MSADRAELGAGAMTFDLFAEELPAPPPAAAAAAAAAPPYMMRPTGMPNEWRYRDVLLGCDMKKAGLIGHWFTLERIDGELLSSDRRVALCRMIDAAAGRAVKP